MIHLNSSPSHPNKDLIYKYLALRRKINAKILKTIFEIDELRKDIFLFGEDKLEYLFSL